MYYQVYDANPQECGPCSWGVEPGEHGWPDPDDYDSPAELLAGVLEFAATTAEGEIWAHVWDDIGQLVAAGSRVVEVES